MSEFVAIAVVTSISVKDGFLKLKTFSDYKQQILNLGYCFVDFFGNIRKIVFDQVVLRGGNIFVKFKDFSQQRELEIFLNKEILIPKNQLVLEKDSYLISDLIGCDVYYRKKFIGIVENVLEVPMNFILEIRRKDNSELLIPFVLKFFDSIDAANKIIYLSKESKFLYDEN